MNFCDVCDTLLGAIDITDEVEAVTLILKITIFTGKGKLIIFKELTMILGLPLVFICLRSLILLTYHWKTSPLRGYIHFIHQLRERDHTHTHTTHTPYEHVYICIPYEVAYSGTRTEMISTSSPWQANLNGESDYNPNVVHLFMRLEFQQRILRVGWGPEGLLLP